MLSKKIIYARDRKDVKVDTVKLFQYKCTEY